MFKQDLSPELKSFAEREFLGERLVWADRPDRRIHALISAAIWLFAIPWTAFALFWMSVPVATLYQYYSGEAIGAPKGAPVAIMWFMALWGLPFVAVGVGMLATPFKVLWKGRRTLYVLTNRRLAVLEGGKTIAITSIAPQEIMGLSRKEGPDGRGTLIVDQGFTVDSDGDRVPKRSELGVIARRQARRDAGPSAQGECGRLGFVAPQPRSIASMSGSLRPKWWPISCTSTWVTRWPSVSSCSAQ